MLDPKLPEISRTLHQSVYPKKLAMELCAECNFACSMCHHPQMRRAKGVLPFELWQRCADETAAHAADTEVWFSFCGEPFLEPELLLRCLQYGRSVGLRSLNVNTNGQLLTRALAEPLLETGLDLIVFGLDAFTAPTYAKIRVNGDRDTVYGNVLHLLETRARLGSRTEVQVQFIEMDENEQELSAFTDFWLPKDVTLKVRNKLSWGGKFDTPITIPASERIACPWALTMMHVFWDGRVPRCPGDTEGEDTDGLSAVGRSVAEVWGELGRFRDLHLSRRFDELPARCHTCKDWMTGAAERVRPGNLEQLTRRRAARRARSA